MSQVAPGPEIRTRPAQVCRLCGDFGPHAAFEVREMMFGTRERFTYRTCGGCGSMQIEDIPDDLGRHYSGGYYSLSMPERGPRPAHTRIARWLRDRHLLDGLLGPFGAGLFSRWPYPELASVGRVPGLRRTARIVDVGCGAGLLLQALRSHGFASVEGVEPHLEPGIETGGLAIHPVRLADLYGPWDLVMYHHALEHVVDPVDELATAAARLAPGGWLLVRMPRVPCAAFARYGADWVGLDAPRHLHIFSDAALSKAAGKAGLEVVFSVQDSTELQFWGSEQYVRDIPLTAAESWAIAPARSPFTRSQVAAWRVEAEQLNRVGAGDQAAYYLRRPQTSRGSIPRN